MWKRVVLIAVFVGGLALHGQEATPVAQSFEVATVKPAKPGAQGEHWDVDGNWTRIENISLLELIRNAYQVVTEGQVLDAPDWVASERFDISAKVSEAEAARQAKLTGQASDDAYGALLLALLKERFGLVVAQETRKLPVYVLTLQGNVPSAALKPTALGPDGRPVRGRNSHGRLGHMDASGIRMEDVAQMMSGRVEFGKLPVEDHTGLKGYFDFTLNWAPDRGGGVAADATEPGLVEALREQLGIRVKRELGDVPVVVVKAVHRPDSD